MDDVVVAFEPAEEPGLEYAEALLTDADLPTADLGSDAVDCYVARAAGERVGVGALELRGPHALVRSVAVEPDRRGEGYGTAIADALETEASDAGAERLFLLTTTARDFFAARGYEVVDREAVPDPIRATNEFADLCPASATVMRKSP
ncbi:arsenic resistance N-acetyltransferase ArsN2 [Halosimplex sp. TS25]|uniref:arsenic resistance N-acetyltransferase ArsN2 n=1 Tax=Halosimplex rarum TaxID=3396619 RepID=UPI0039EC3E73